MASIMKNHAQHEQHIFNFSLSLTNMDNMSKIGSFQPADVLLVNGLVKYLHGLHVDYDTDDTKPPIIYDVANSCITELRGNSTDFTLDGPMINSILLHVLPMANPMSILSLHDKYLLFTRTYPRRFVNNITGFIKGFLKDKVRFPRLLVQLRGACNDEDYQQHLDDIQYLQVLVDPPYTLM